MAKPPPAPDWLEALRRPSPGLSLGDRSNAQAFLPPVCTRCRRPGEVRESWLERRRLRTPDPAAPGGFRYSHAIREHLLCGPCYLEVRRGQAPVHSPFLKVAALVLAITALIAGTLSYAAPSLVAAFWRNGAAPYGWRAGHTEGRPSVSPLR